MAVRGVIQAVKERVYDTLTEAGRVGQRIQTSSTRLRRWSPLTMNSGAAESNLLAS